MNYFSFHVGDYSAHTAHLDLMEDLAYRRMLDLYYRTEKPLPADIAQLARLLRMRDQQAQIESVLKEFFLLTPDGWINGRCDVEIAAYQDRSSKAKKSAQASVAVRREKSQAFVERSLSDGSANQEPRTNNQEPITKNQEENTNTACATDAGRVCVSFRAHGINDVNPGHPGLLSLIAAGATDEEFIGAASTAKERGKGFAYAIGMLKRQRAEAAQPPPTRAGPQEPEWRKEQRERNEEFAGPASASRRATKQTAEVIDVTARRLG